MNRIELKEKIQQRWQGEQCRFGDAGSICEITCTRPILAQLCGFLFLDWGISFAGLVVEEGSNEWQLRYIFYGDF